MKELLIQYTRYNVWANKLIIDAMLALEPGGVDKEIVSSFPSIRKTVLHMWAAEDIWLQRLQQVAKPVWVAAAFDGTFEQACQNWQQASEQLLSLVSETEEAALHHMLDYHDSKGNPWQQNIWQVLQHVSNHATYHRGQLVTMLRQAGATTVPALDFIFFMRRELQSV